MIERVGPKPESSRNLRVRLATNVWNFLINKAELRISLESQENLAKLNKLLLTNSAVVYINHTSRKDALVGISMIGKLPNVINVLGPVGMKHYDWTRDPLSAALFRILPLIHIQPSPVVQVNDEKEYGKKRQRMIENLKRQTSIMMQQTGSIYGIALEGTRNKKNGVLQKANRGIGYLERYQDLFYVPVYIKYKPKFEVVVGKPLQLDDIIPNIPELSYNPKERAQEIADFHMKNLANLMPHSLRGIYA